VTQTQFLNIHTMTVSSSSYFAYIAGFIKLGLEPRVTPGIPGGRRRLDRIFSLVSYTVLEGDYALLFD